LSRLAENKNKANETKLGPIICLEKSILKKQKKQMRASPKEIEERTKKIRTKH
jgi:hypothetical protein